MIIETTAPVNIDIDVDVEIDLDNLDFDDLLNYVKSKCNEFFLAENSYKVNLTIRELSALQGEKDNLIWLIEKVTGKELWEIQ